MVENASYLHICQRTAQIDSERTLCHFKYLLTISIIETSLSEIKIYICLFELMLYVPVNSNGHVHFIGLLPNIWMS